MFEALESGPVDLVTLDLMLERGEDGLLLARELRTRRNVPVLVITAKGEPFDRVHGLEAGADDYVVKPFLIREVVLRIHRILALYAPAVAGNATVKFDDTAFDLRRKIVRRAGGETVGLTGIELQLLELFVRHPGRVMSRDELSHALWGRDWSPLDRSLDGHVARLRRKIEPPGEAPTLIRSVRGVGYVFAGEVTPSAAPA